MQTRLPSGSSSLGLPLLTWLTGLFRVLLGSSGSTNTSWEHHIRADLLDNYDRKVRPVFTSKRVVEVSFAMRVSRLVKVVRPSTLYAFPSFLSFKVVCTIFVLSVTNFIISSFEKNYI